MSAASIISQAFGKGACLYETVLDVPRDANPSQLRKAYYKKALQYHPDKLDAKNSTVEERDAAKTKFQAVSLAYTILSNEEKRAEYDESGGLYDDDDDVSSNEVGVKQWMDYFKHIFPTVTTADIDAFEVKYKCSDEEETDVLKYYTQFKGDLNKMLECVMLSTDVDKERWMMDYIQPAIHRGDVKDFSEKLKMTLGINPPKKKSKNALNKKKVFEKEVVSTDDENTPTAEIIMEEDDDDNTNDKNSAKHSRQKSRTNGNSTKVSPKKKSSIKKTVPPGGKSSPAKKTQDDLIERIRGNALARKEMGFNSMMAGLEERYGGSQKNRKGKKIMEDIPDDEFEKIQASILKNKRKTKPL